MIQDIPDANDFIKAGKAQFDFAWDIVISFLKIFDEAGDYGIDAKEGEQEFWDAARQRILTALAITQQGVELIIKGKIVAISPYLLIAGNPSDWPKPNKGSTLYFSDFRTIDAQDLIKTYNTFSDKKITEEFIQKFEALRKSRNRIMHTVDKSLKFSAIEVITKILEMHDLLISDEKWVKTRKEFLEEAPETLLFFADDVEARLASEFFIVFTLLKPAEVSKFFGVNKKNRNYLCPQCCHYSEDYSTVSPKYALLEPNKPRSKHLYCFVCDDRHSVRRKKCTENDCLGNVISDEYGICCTCGASQS